jgi:hypothetical protein
LFWKKFTIKKIAELEKNKKTMSDKIKLCTIEKEKTSAEWLYFPGSYISGAV